MPPGKRQQSSAMLYTLITFVGLFIAATTVAVIYYVRAEEYRTNVATLESQINELATKDEIRNIGTLVGTSLPGKSRLGTMVDYLDKTASLIMGSPLDPTSAEVKINNAQIRANEALKQAQQHIESEVLDPNTTGLVSTIDKMYVELTNVTNARTALKEQLTKLQQQFDDARQASLEKEQELTTEKEKYYQQVMDITEEHNKLKSLMEQTSEERVQTLIAQLRQEEDNSKRLSDELSETQARLEMTSGRLNRALEELQKIRPQPDREVTAFQPDGEVVLVDEQMKVVHLSLGSNDGVYQGLTFSVYDKNIPIPKSGIGKAEVEVFAVDKNISIARILPPINYQTTLAGLHVEFTDATEIAQIMLSLEKPFDERAQDFDEFARGSPKRLKILNNLAAAYEQRKNRRPITVEDVVINLIWDKGKINKFVVAGDFDVDGDGYFDYDAIDKIRKRIEDWGSTVANEVSVETDYVVLGIKPPLLQRPTIEDLELDPMAEQKYTEAQERRTHYEQIQNNAQSLSIPIFGYERFLYLIGYKEQASKPGAF
jgi:predicted  nucleic acid-binding Zn-ribbon protein